MKNTEELIADEIAQFLVSANKDLVQAEMEENYEQCALIQTAIHLKMANEAHMIHTYNTGYTLNQIFYKLKYNSDWIYNAIKEKFSQ